MENNELDVKYSKETFNFLMQVLNYCFEREKDPYCKDSIYNLMNKIKASHKWEIAERTSVILTFDVTDFSVVHYCYESVLLETLESKNNIYGHTDYFTIYFEEDQIRKDNE